MTVFKDLLIGGHFHRGTFFGIGATSKIIHVVIHKKISKSCAEIIDTCGYGNNRQIGSLVPLAWCTEVIPCNNNFTASLELSLRKDGV